MKMIIRSCVVLVLLTMVSCAPFLPGYETPTVNITSFRALPGESIVPTFEIGLHVSNPNRIPLKLQGLTYSVSIENYRVLNGLTNQLPAIAAYGQEQILLEARPDLLTTISFFSSLISQPRDSFRFDLEAVLDPGGIWPKIRVSRDGMFQFGSSR